jgi:Helix-turn-helix domain
MPLDVARQFATNLRKARRRAGLSQEEVGWLASLHRTEIGLLETTRARRASTPWSRSPQPWTFRSNVLYSTASPGTPAAPRRAGS